MTDTTARAAHYFDRNIAPAEPAAERAAGLSDDDRSWTHSLHP
ncbi:hypothetical protein ACLQ22_09965 [Micromonospora sp. DT178]